MELRAFHLEIKDLKEELKFKKFEVDDQCFGESSVRAIVTVIQMSKDRWYLQVINIITGLYTLIQGTKEACQLEGIAFDVSSFCFTHACDFYTMFDNFENELFKIISNINRVLGAIFDMDRSNNDSIFDSFDRMGDASGKITRYVLGYIPS